LGYAVQALDRQHRIAAGETVIGAKLGLTSVAKQNRMKVGRPVVGYLTDAMRVDPNSKPPANALIQPRIEPEIAFILGQTIDSPLTHAEATRAVDAVTVAAEVIDSRFAGYRFRAADVIADNTSAAGVFLGTQDTDSPISKT
jgi:2-oxo-3-hexenedioate decarboxylase